MEVIHKRFGFNIRIAKLIAESFALILAFYFSRAIGIATVLLAFTTGYFIQLFLPKFEQLFSENRHVVVQEKFTVLLVKLGDIKLKY
jgi:uncharacterized membrane protein YczE